MSESYRSSVSLDVDPTGDAGHPVEPDERFSILIVGDFGSGSNPSVRRPVGVDRDNFDEVLAGMRPEVVFSQGVVSFLELDDFHPDRIFRQCEWFRRFGEERSLGQKDATATPPTSAAASGLLDQILDLSGDAPPKPAPEFTGDLSEFIRAVTASHLAPKENASQKEKKARQDLLYTAAMQAVLHNPRFQAVEALWRSVAWLIHGLDTDGDLRIFLLNMPVEQLTSDPARAQRLLSG